jgi:quinol monooxygenase YgiN
MKPALYAVTVEMAPDSEPACLQWLQKLHIPEVLREPGFLRCRLWKDTAPAQDGWARYVVHYELTSQDAVEQYLNGEAVKRLRADGVARFGSAMRATRATLTEVAHFG